MGSLKKCPFCGGKAQIIERANYSYLTGKETPRFIAQCAEMKCIGRVTKRYRTVEEAIAAWNRRKADG